jgi:hypothetical protein
MTFVKHEHEIGDLVTTNKAHSSPTVKFEAGMQVKIIGISNRGFSIMDTHGNKIHEIGWEI